MLYKCCVAFLALLIHVTVVRSSLVVRELDSIECTYHLSLPATEPTQTHSLSFLHLSLCTIMSHLSADAKHHILLEYTPHSHIHSFSALARRHGIKGGRQTINQWYQQWDGTAASLLRKEGTGKQRILNLAEISRHIRAPILAANRSHRAIHYTDLLPSIQAKTRTKVSLRTVQRYGKEEYGVKKRRTTKRTADESEYIYI
jgi:hypothetical protein